MSSGGGSDVKSSSELNKDEGAEDEEEEQEEEEDEEDEEENPVCPVCGGTPCQWGEFSTEEVV